MGLQQKLHSSLEAFAHLLISHGKDAFIALHGEDKAKEALPVLGDILKKKADELLVKAATKI